VGGGGGEREPRDRRIGECGNTVRAALAIKCRALRETARHRIHILYVCTYMFRPNSTTHTVYYVLTL
jgi:hypothetical protein